MCKTMAQPPAGVDHVFAAVLALFANVFVHEDVQKDGRIRDKSWQVAKKLLLKNLGTFMQNLTDFKAQVDNEAVPAVNWKEVSPYLQMEHFNVEVIMKRNSAAGGLCAWVHNIVSYNDTLVATKPLRVRALIGSPSWTCAVQ
jgi:dynein heavy chain